MATVRVCAEKLVGEGPLGRGGMMSGRACMNLDFRLFV